MYIKQLHVTGLRIIKEAKISPAPGINLITGDNGAGKTSILEAIYLLGRGKSFRHRESGPFIRSGYRHSIVLADLVKDNGKNTRLGVERAVSSIKVKHDGNEVPKRSMLLRALPLQIIAPKSHELIEKGPESRRNFMDYGMFHVEHGYLEQLTDYNRALKQRNAALRATQLDVARSYNPVLSGLAENIQHHRSSYIQLLTETLQQTLSRLEVEFPVEISLKPGMDTDSNLEEQLRIKESIDLKRGFTTVGIHRADLVIKTEQMSAANRLSRGQQKTLVYGLKIAQSIIYRAKTDTLPILMVDDISAELDSKHLLAVIQQFVDLEIQVFITLVSAEHIHRIPDAKLFHVEHGVFSESNF